LSEQTFDASDFAAYGLSGTRLTTDGSLSNVPKESSGIGSHAGGPSLWARPHAYLDRAIRAATSPWHDIPKALIEPALVRLREDLETGRWQCRYGDLLTRTELDVGLRLITSRKDIETDQMRL